MQNEPIRFGVSTVIRFLSSGRTERIFGLQHFLLLQLLDVVTTIIGFEVGLSEASPFIRYMMQVGPIAGLLLSKVVAILLAAFCIASGRYQVIRYVNFWYAALVAWNFALILSR